MVDGSFLEESKNKFYFYQIEIVLFIKGVLQMILRALNKEEIKQIYDTEMQDDFPASELKPLSAIYRMIDAGHYEGKGLYEGNELLAYVLLSYTVPEDVALIDYLAVCSKYRAKGIGSKLISVIREGMSEWKGIVLEVENPEFAINEAEYNVQCRRINFYLKNNIKSSEVKVSVFDVPFRIMHFTGFSLKESSVRKGIENIYRVMFPKEVFDKFVRFD